MYLRKTSLIICFVCFFFVWVFPAWAQTTLNYKKRFNEKGESYHEGIISIFTHPNNIELIAALVHRYVPAKQMPEKLRLEFYLERPAEVHLTVQELEYKYYYQMDRVIPFDDSTAEEDNTFEWSTQQVLKHLEGIDLYNLGAVARLNKPEPSLFEEVAPVIFYHSEPPDITEREYLFIFRTNGDVELNSSIYKEGPGKLVPIKNIFVGVKRWGGRWFLVPWNGSEAEEGYYQLKVTGYFLNDNRPIDQIVRFYHHK